MTLGEIAHRLGCRLEGEGTIEIARAATLGDAVPGDLAFFAHPRYLQALATTRASAVILAEGAPAPPCAALRAANPYLAFAEALVLLAGDERPAAGIHPLASVAPDARVGDGVAIGPFAVVESGAEIGDRTVVGPHVTIGAGAAVGPDCVLHPHASVRDRCVLGARVVLQNGAVVGSDGYGFVRRPDGTHLKIPQRAPVVIEDDVEIGANTTIDRPAVGETRIRAGVKIDNLVQIAHGVTIGERTLLAAQVGIAGSTSVGQDVVLGGQVGVAGHLTLGDRVKATAQTGIPNSLDADAFVSGYPAIDNREWLKASAVFKRLPELKRRVAELAARIEALEARLGASDR